VRAGIDAERRNAAQACRFARPGLDALAVPPRITGAGERERTQGADQQQREVLPARRIESNVLQQVELLPARVVQHPLVPAVVQALPAAAQPGE
jgi:hypothetical protein